MAYIGNTPAELVTELDNGVVTTAKLADDAVTAAKIIDGTIISDDLNDGIITNAKVSASAAIAASKLAISGGSNITLQSDGTFDLDNTVDVTGGYSVSGTTVIDSSRVGSLESLSVGTTNTSAQLVVGDDTDTTATLLQLRNDDATYSQSWTFSSDTSKDLVITGASSSGGVKFSPGTRGVDINSGPLKIGGTTVIDSSRNITNIGGATVTSLTASGSGNEPAAFITTGSFVRPRISTQGYSGTPETSLHFQQYSSASDTRDYYMGIYAVNNANPYMYFDNRTGGTHKWQHNGSTRMELDGSGNLDIYGAFRKSSTLQFVNMQQTDRTVRFGTFSDDSASYFGPNNDAASDELIDLGVSDGRWRNLNISGEANLGTLNTQSTDATVYGNTTDTRHIGNKITAQNKSNTTGTVTGFTLFTGSSTGSAVELNAIRNATSYQADFAIKARTAASSFNEMFRLGNAGTMGLSYSDVGSANPQYGQFEILKDDVDAEWSYLSFHEVGSIAWQMGINTNNFTIGKTGGAPKTNIETEYFSISATDGVVKAHTNLEIGGAGIFKNVSSTENFIITASTTPTTTQPSMALWHPDHSDYPGQVHIVGRNSNASASSGDIQMWNYNGSSWKNIFNFSTDSDGNFYRSTIESNVDQNLAITGKQSVYMLIDSNNTRTDRGFFVEKNTSVPGQGNELFRVKEDGGATFNNITTYRSGVVGVNASNTRWFKLINYAGGAMFKGRITINVNRNGGYNQTGAYRTYFGSIGGYANAIYGPLNASGVTGEGGVATVVLGTDEAMYLRVNSSIYGGSVAFVLEGYTANWQFDGTYTETDPTV